MNLFAALGLGIVVLGTTLACLAPRCARAGATLETAAGLLVVTGLAMIGSQLHVFFS